jgi:hypothetical protein
VDSVSRGSGVNIVNILIVHVVSLDAIIDRAILEQADRTHTHTHREREREGEKRDRKREITPSVDINTMYRYFVSTT